MVLVTHKFVCPGRRSEEFDDRDLRNAKMLWKKAKYELAKEKRRKRKFMREQRRKRMKEQKE